MKITWLIMLKHFDYSRVSPEKAAEARLIALKIKALDMTKDFRVIGELMTRVFLKILPTSLHREWVEYELGELMTFKQAFEYYLTDILDEEELLDLENL